MRRRKDAVGLWPGATLLGFAALLAVSAQSCAHTPAPRQVEDLCGLFAERGEWRAAALRAGARWDVPPGVLLAVIHQESRFRAEARPWWRLLGVVPVAPASSAYGFGQATDGTWHDYRRATGRRGARRDDFADAVDFVGWYADVIHRATRVAKHDAYHLYLAYHEGPGGFARGSHRGKPWLLGVARRVAERAALWDQEAERCGADPPLPSGVALRGSSSEPATPARISPATTPREAPTGTL